jgi:hypothetical protein
MKDHSRRWMSRASKGRTSEVIRYFCRRALRGSRACAKQSRSYSAMPRHSSASASIVRQLLGYRHTRRTHSREFSTRHRSPLAHGCGVNTSRTLHSTPVRSTTICGYCLSAAPVPPNAGKRWPSASTLQDTRSPTAVLVKDPAFSQPAAHATQSWNTSKSSCRAQCRRRLPRKWLCGRGRRRGWLRRGDRSQLRSRRAGCRSASRPRPSRALRVWSA